MVGLYRTGPVGYFGGKIILTIKDRLLPNLIAGSRIAPEFVPYWGGARPVARALEPLLDSQEARQCQAAAISGALKPYAGVPFAETATNAILEVVGPGQ